MALLGSCFWGNVVVGCIRILQKARFMDEKGGSLKLIFSRFALVSIDLFFAGCLL